MSAAYAMSQGVPVSDIPDPVGLLRRAGILMSEEAERLDAIERARYVLVRMDQGEVWRCRNCGSKHVSPVYGAVFTTYCVPRPWRGLRDGLVAYFRHMSARLSDLSPAQVATLREIAPRIGRSDALPVLADHHPQAAQALGTTAGDVDYVGWLLGSVVEITEYEARRFVATINARAGRVAVRM